MHRRSRKGEFARDWIIVRALSNGTTALTTLALPKCWMIARLDCSASGNVPGAVRG
jgi:hypothetical protein